MPRGVTLLVSGDVWASEANVLTELVSVWSRHCFGLGISAVFASTGGQPSALKTLAQLGRRKVDEIKSSNGCCTSCGAPGMPVPLSDNPKYMIEWFCRLRIKCTKHRHCVKDSDIQSSAVVLSERAVTFQKAGGVTLFIQPEGVRVIFNFLSKGVTFSLKMRDHGGENTLLEVLPRSLLPMLVWLSIVPRLNSIKPDQEGEQLLASVIQTMKAYILKGVVHEASFWFSVGHTVPERPWAELISVGKAIK
ncbi:hypothetical protein C8R47DRAFT_1076312 [Mycena vitilis]|nr:hypothetical protein C8R47DRAFT_1076312 [Mycena vitilis]